MIILKFIWRRLATALLAITAVLIAAFLLVRLTPNPVALIAGPEATAEQLRMVQKQLGLDKSVPEQFITYVGHVLTGDFGRSWISGRPVLTEIAERAPFTIELLLWGVAIGTVLGVMVGLHAAYRRDGWFDQVTRFASLVGFSVPTYFLGLLMLLVFFYVLEWAPPGMGRLSPLYSAPPFVVGSYVIDGLIAGNFDVARSAAAQLVLPVLCIAIICAAPTIKQTRALALEALEGDYVRYGRAQGMPPRMITPHGAAQLPCTYHHLCRYRASKPDGNHRNHRICLLVGRARPIWSFGDHGGRFQRRARLCRVVVMFLRHDLSRCRHDRSPD
jgi:ABC-type dipeptide/oligopeptide/nickel transport system permease component